MADTLGGLVDKLMTVDLKMWNNQELFYEIRRMTFEDFKNEYFKDEACIEKLWLRFKKACDLNVQRSQLIDEIDEKVIEIVESSKNGDDLDNGKFIQRKHKTY